MANRPQPRLDCRMLDWSSIEDQTKSLFLS
jgi:hypothetical protein